MNTKLCTKSISAFLLLSLFAAPAQATVFSLNDKGELVAEEVHDFRYESLEIATADPAPGKTDLDSLVARIETVSGNKPKVFDETNHAAIIAHEAAKYTNVNVDMIHAVIKAESAYNPMAVSPKGAEGLMQLMPATSRRLGVENAFIASENIRGGTYELSRLMALYDEQLPLALAAYNAGEHAVQKYGGIPPYDETQGYVTSVLEEIIRRQGELLAAQPAP